MNDLSNNFLPPARVAGTSLERVLQAICEWDDLSLVRRKRLAAQASKGIQIQLAVADADHRPPRFSCEAFNATLWRRAGACFGLSSRRSVNTLVSDIRYSLVRLGLHARDAELTADWQALYDQLTDERKKGLIRFMRYCSAGGIAPSDVTQKTLDDFEAWCRTSILKEDIGGLARRVASGWNWAKDNVGGWRQVVLHRQDMRDHYTLPLQAYPPSFRDDVKAYLANLAADQVETLVARGRVFTQIGHSPRSRPRPLRKRTLETRQHCIRAAAAALHAAGRPIEQIRSLRDLVDPLENPETIIRFHHRRRRKRQISERYQTRPSGLIAIIETLRQIAKYHCGLQADHVATLANWKAMVTPAEQATMSPKNYARLLVLLQPDIYAKMLHLPQVLLKRAQAIWNDAKEEKAGAIVPPPADAVRLVMFALAIEILLFVPLRRKNLVELHLDRDFIRSGPRQRITEILIQGSETKNGQIFHWGVADSIVDLIELWMKHFRPVLAGPNHRFLFPGGAGGNTSRDACEFGNYLGELVEREVGAEFNMHVARHFAVVRYLRKHPGQYGVVSKLLGHRKVQTTMDFYCGLEAEAAAREVNKTVLDDRDSTRNLAAQAYGRRRKRSAKPKRRA
jgi:integrase